MLKFIVGPLVFLCIGWAVMTMADLTKLGKIFLGFLPYWLFVGLIASYTAYIVGNTLKPGEGVLLPGEAKVTPVSLSLADYIKNIVPSNFIDMFLNLRMLQIILAAILIGMAIGSIGRTTPQVKDFLVRLFEALLAVVYKLLDFILWYAPIGVFALMANVAAVVGVIAVSAFAKLVLAFYISGLIMLLLIQPLLLAVVARVNPVRFWTKSVSVTAHRPEIAVYAIKINVARIEPQSPGNPIASNIAPAAHTCAPVIPINAKSDNRADSI